MGHSSECQERQGGKDGVVDSRRTVGSMPLCRCNVLTFHFIYYKFQIRVVEAVVIQKTQSH